MRVGIVGFGIGGATAGAAMAKRGIDFTIFEQAQAIREVGAGVATWPNTIRLLSRMGLSERLREIGCVVGTNPIRNRGGEVLHHVPPNSYDDTPGYYLHRAELLEAIASLIPRERVRLGAQCKKVEQNGDKVFVSLKSGEVEEFDVVIGADGIKTVVADAVIGASQPIYSNLSAYRGLVSNEGPVRLDGCNLWTDRKKYFVAFPVSGGRLVNFVGVTPTEGLPEESWFMQGDVAALANEYKDWDPVVQRIISSAKETFRWGLYYRQPSQRIVEGRIALMGDAAPPMLIHAGQGMGQALEDGVALAVLLDGATQATIVQRLLQYQELRLARATAVQKLSRHNAQFLHEAVPLDPGEQRPERQSPVEWIVNYDVEREAEKLLGSNGVASAS